MPKRRARSALAAGAARQGHRGRSSSRMGGASSTTGRGGRQRRRATSGRAAACTCKRRWATMRVRPRPPAQVCAPCSAPCAACSNTSGPTASEVSLLLAGLLIDLAFNVLFSLSFQYVIDEASRQARRGAALQHPRRPAGRRGRRRRRRGDARLPLRPPRHRGDERPAPADVRAPAAVVEQLLHAACRSATSSPASRPTSAPCRTRSSSPSSETILGILGVTTIATLLFIFSWQLALITLIGLPLATLGLQVLGPRAERDSYLVRHEEAQIASTVQENLGAHAVRARLPARARADQPVPLQAALALPHRRALQPQHLPGRAHPQPHLPAAADHRVLASARSRPSRASCRSARWSRSTSCSATSAPTSPR